jgi:ABC-2 type transport system permease protein
MRNILAIASKELKSYFSSPVGWILLGFWSLLYGYFFVAILNFFVRQSMQMSQFGQAGPQAMNVNQQLLRPLIAQNLPILVLFLLPAVTMRTYSEERRSGTIELLLTSPLTDFQIILGKFLGAMGLYAAMIAITAVHMALLFSYGNPEWKVVVTGYIGLLLMGGCFISVGLLISSLTKNQIVSGMVTFAVFLMLWVINWIASFMGPTTQSVLNYLSITDHFDDFTRGILDTKHLVYYFSVMSFGLFLTARSVDTERWKG